MWKRFAALLLVLALMAPATGLAAFGDKNLTDKGSMVIGSSGDGIKEVQKLLKKYGYFSGTVDGKYGQSTAAAVRLFQSRNGLKVDGKVGAKTLAVLESGDVIEATGETQGLTANGSLVVGSTGEEVVELQTLLKELGYFKGNADGVFSKTTETAVKAFQTRNGLIADGKVGYVTWNRLHNNPVQKGETLNGSLSTGATGEEVEELQTLLKEFGYYTSSISGTFDAATAAAVRAFQTRNGLTVDGKVGKNTWKVLRSGAENVVKKNDKVPVYYTIATGSNGAEVEELQLQLRETYFYTGKIDAVFGAEMVRAVKEFQAAAGLIQDGKAGAKTQKALYNRAASMFNGGYPVRTLKQGNRGYDVYVLQKKLADLNYLTVKYTDGYFDAATAAAVKKVQKANNLTQDGVFGKVVRRYLWPTDVALDDDLTAAELGTDYDEYLGKTLKEGSTGDEVAYAQMKLKSAGYLLGNADGVYGATTKAAVLKLQKEINKQLKAGNAAVTAMLTDSYGITALKEDGIIGQETWVVIRLLLSTENAEPVVTDPDKVAVGAHIDKLRRGNRGAQVT
ncbi:MAG: peptidoglycan-binding protein, partial [Clostridia bacterium]|nr:peptidoglycan-binding protein [Clostridia bacterium]